MKAGHLEGLESLEKGCQSQVPGSTLPDGVKGKVAGPEASFTGKRVTPAGKGKENAAVDPIRTAGEKRKRLTDHISQH